MGVELVQKQIDYLLLIEEELYKIMGEVYQKPLEKDQNLQEVVKRVYQKRQQINDNHKKDMELLDNMAESVHYFRAYHGCTKYKLFKEEKWKGVLEAHETRWKLFRYWNINHVFNLDEKEIRQRTQQIKDSTSMGCLPAELSQFQCFQNEKPVGFLLTLKEYFRQAYAQWIINANIGVKKGQNGELDFSEFNADIDFFTQGNNNVLGHSFLDCRLPEDFGSHQFCRLLDRIEEYSALKSRKTKEQLKERYQQCLENDKKRTLAFVAELNDEARKVVDDYHKFKTLPQTEDLKTRMDNFFDEIKKYASWDYKDKEARKAQFKKCQEMCDEIRVYSKDDDEKATNYFKELLEADIGFSKSIFTGEKILFDDGKKYREKFLNAKWGINCDTSKLASSMYHVDLRNSQVPRPEALLTYSTTTSKTNLKWIRNIHYLSKIYLLSQDKYFTLIDDTQSGLQCLVNADEIDKVPAFKELADKLLPAVKQFSDFREPHKKRDHEKNAFVEITDLDPVAVQKACEGIETAINALKNYKGKIEFEGKCGDYSYRLISQITALSPARSQAITKINKVVDAFEKNGCTNPAIFSQHNVSAVEQLNSDFTQKLEKTYRYQQLIPIRKYQEQIMNLLKTDSEVMRKVDLYLALWRLFGKAYPQYFKKLKRLNVEQAGQNEILGLIRDSVIDVVDINRAIQNCKKADFNKVVNTAFNNDNLKRLNAIYLTLNFPQMVSIHDYPPMTAHQVYNIKNLKNDCEKETQRFLKLAFDLLSIGDITEINHLSDRLQNSIQEKLEDNCGEKSLTYKNYLQYVENKKNAALFSKKYQAQKAIRALLNKANHTIKLIKSNQSLCANPPRFSSWCSSKEVLEAAKSQRKSIQPRLNLPDSFFSYAFEKLTYDENMPFDISDGDLPPVEQEVSAYEKFLKQIIFEHMRYDQIYSPLSVFDRITQSLSSFQQQFNCFKNFKHDEDIPQKVEKIWENAVDYSDLTKLRDTYWSLDLQNRSLEKFLHFFNISTKLKEMNPPNLPFDLINFQENINFTDWHDIDVFNTSFASKFNEYANKLLSEICDQNQFCEDLINKINEARVSLSGYSSVCLEEPDFSLLNDLESYTHKYSFSRYPRDIFDSMDQVEWLINFHHDAVVKITKAEIQLKADALMSSVENYKAACIKEKELEIKLAEEEKQRQQEKSEKQAKRVAEIESLKIEYWGKKKSLEDLMHKSSDYPEFDDKCYLALSDTHDKIEAILEGLNQAELEKVKALPQFQDLEKTLSEQRDKAKEEFKRIEVIREKEKQRQREEHARKAEQKRQRLILKEQKRQEDIRKEQAEIARIKRIEDEKAKILSAEMARLEEEEKEKQARLKIIKAQEAQIEALRKAEQARKENEERVAKAEALKMAQIMAKAESERQSAIQDILKAINKLEDTAKKNVDILIKFSKNIPYKKTVFKSDEAFINSVSQKVGEIKLTLPSLTLNQVDGIKNELNTFFRGIKKRAKVWESMKEALQIHQALSKQYELFAQKKYPSEIFNPNHMAHSAEKFLEDTETENRQIQKALQKAKQEKYQKIEEARQKKLKLAKKRMTELETLVDSLGMKKQKLDQLNTKNTKIVEADKKLLEHIEASREKIAELKSVQTKLEQEMPKEIVDLPSVPKLLQSTQTLLDESTEFIKDTESLVKRSDRCVEQFKKEKTHYVEELNLFYQSQLNASHPVFNEIPEAFTPAEKEALETLKEVLSVPTDIHVTHPAQAAQSANAVIENSCEFEAEPVKAVFQIYREKYAKAINASEAREQYVNRIKMVYETLLKFKLSEIKALPSQKFQKLRSLLFLPKEGDLSQSIIRQSMKTLSEQPLDVRLTYEDLIELYSEYEKAYRDMSKQDRLIVQIKLDLDNLLAELSPHSKKDLEYQLIKSKTEAWEEQYHPTNPILTFFARVGAFLGNRGEWVENHLPFEEKSEKKRKALEVDLSMLESTAEAKKDELAAKQIKETQKITLKQNQPAVRKQHLEKSEAAKQQAFEMLQKRLLECEKTHENFISELNHLSYLGNKDKQSTQFQLELNLLKVRAILNAFKDQSLRLQKEEKLGNLEIELELQEVMSDKAPGMKALEVANYHVIIKLGREKKHSQSAFYTFHKFTNIQTTLLAFEETTAKVGEMIKHAQSLHKLAQARLLMPALRRGVGGVPTPGMLA